MPERISVVITCHDYGRFLEEAVDSVLSQSRPADEIVVVDDGSTDNTAAVVARLRTRVPGIVAVRHGRARGPARAANAGLARTSGSLLVLLDADDRLSPTYLADTSEALAATGADIAYTGEVLFGAARGSRPAPPFDPRRLRRQNYINKSAMFRRWVLDATGGLRPDFDGLGMEDWELWVHALALGATATPVGSCWLDYRRHPAGSRNVLSRRTDARIHLRMWRLHRDVVGMDDLAAWLVGAALRRAGRTLRPLPR